MKIGIDLDEVVRDTLNQVIKFYNNKTNSSFTLKDFHSYNWDEVWGGTREQAINIWFEFNKSGLSYNISPIKDSISSIYSLSENNELIIITTQATELKNEATNWINKHFKDLSLEIIFSGGYYGKNKESKAEIYKRLGVDIIIEDHSKYATECAQSGIKTILFDKPWNQGISHSNITRVSGWPEALNYISALTSK